MKHNEHLLDKSYFEKVAALFNKGQSDPLLGETMWTWNDLQEGFTANERLPDTLVDIAVWPVFNRAPQLYRQAPQIKTRPA